MTRDDTSVYEVVVISMGTNPEPVHSIGNFYTNGAMMYADSHRPETSNLLEMEGWVTWVPLEQGKGFVSEFWVEVGSAR